MKNLSIDIAWAFCATKLFTNSSTHLSCKRINTLQKIDIFFPSFKHQIWRWFYYFFNREKVLQSVEKRKGDCKRCGGCCSASIQCSSLAFDKNGYAMCMEHERRPRMCKLYPFSDRDHFLHLKDKCGFWYDG
ncbi:MAG: hypothetical protein GY777_10795 [Candidatus Brocadiaceae bacterium]|nr:hypothetical protein [Candidatus Brocadiaceae bacterium]